MAPRGVRDEMKARLEVVLLQRIADYVRKHGRTHYSIIALHIKRSPSWVAQRARAVEELFADIVYDDGYFDVLPSSKRREGE